MSICVYTVFFKKIWHLFPNRPPFGSIYLCTRRIYSLYFDAQIISGSLASTCSDKSSHPAYGPNKKKKYGPARSSIICTNFFLYHAPL
jgi:hypothetical protein